MATQTEGRPQLALSLVGFTGLLFGFLSPEDRTDRLSRNVGKKLPNTQG